MDTKDEALCKIAIDALHAMQRGCTRNRHSDLWQLAISRVLQTKREIEADEDVAIRAPIRHMDKYEWAALKQILRNESEIMRAMITVLIRQGAESDDPTVQLLRLAGGKTSELLGNYNPN